MLWRGSEVFLLRLIQDDPERNDLRSRPWLFFSPSLFPPKKRGKKKRTFMCPYVTFNDLQPFLPFYNFNMILNINSFISSKTEDVKETEFVEFLQELFQGIKCIF